MIYFVCSQSDGAVRSVDAGVMKVLYVSNLATRETRLKVRKEAALNCRKF